MAKTVADLREDVEKGCSTSTATAKKVCRVNHNKGYLFVKRVFDIFVSLTAGLLLLLPMLVVALLIAIESPGPVIYTQERLGKNGKPFRIFKFRSMQMDAEKNGPQWAEIQDPRCTKVGRVLRRWHIDELPQILNVLKGDMSIVGPRPERAYFYDMFEEELPNYKDRMLVSQGLTCIGQVTLYDEQLTPANKIACDLAYIEQQSLWLDMKCILKTFGAVVKNKGV